MRLILTEGQAADITSAAELIEGLRAKAVIADKGYDADAPVQSIRAAGAKAVIPPRSNRLSKLTLQQGLVPVWCFSLLKGRRWAWDAQNEPSRAPN